MSKKTLGQIGFEAYGDHANWTAYDGKPMPRWDDNLRPDIKEKWEVACEAVRREVVAEALAKIPDAEMWNELERKTFDTWLEEHNATHHNGKHPYAGAIGGALTFEITGTSLGTVLKVRCMCGEVKDLTDYDW